MKEIVMIGSDDVESLNTILNGLNKSLGKDWEMSIVEQKNLRVLEASVQAVEEKYLILNIDMNAQMDLSAYVGFTVITVGFKSKASVTVSSIADGEIVFCIQRDIIMQNYEIESQEFVFRGNFFGASDVLNTIFAFTTMLLLQEKDIEKSLLKTSSKE